MWRRRRKRPDAGPPPVVVPPPPAGLRASVLGGGRPMTHTGSVRPVFAATAVLMTTAAIAYAQEVNDYPTSARAEYVFGCLKANGETRQAIDRCSCSIDVIASLLPYDRLYAAKTVLSNSEARRERGGHFRSSAKAASVVNDLRRAQAEAEVRC